MPSLLNKHSIFESTAQRLDELNPADLRPMLDRCVIRDPPERERKGILFIPEVARETKHIRFGVVVAIGPGDKYTEKLTSRNTFDADGRPPREFKLLAKRAPMFVKLGDTVLFDRRHESEFHICGERYGILHQEQSIIGIKEGKVIIPLYDRLIVKRMEEGDAKVGSLYIPETAKEKPQRGTVIAVGQGKRDVNGQMIPLDVKVGDRVLFGKYTGAEIGIGEVEYLIMREDEVYAREPRAAESEQGTV